MGQTASNNTPPTQVIVASELHPIKVPFVPLIIFALFLLVSLMIIAPANFYLAFYSLFGQQAIKVNSDYISWNQLNETLTLVSADKNLRTRDQKLKAAIDKAIERKLLQVAMANRVKFASVPDTFTEINRYKLALVDDSINWRSGGYVIARFTIPGATESASVLKDKAKNEVSKFKTRLDQGEDFQSILKDATQSAVLNYLNGGAFLSASYLNKITETDFPVKIKSLRQQFFNLPARSTSNLLTLSWDDYDGPSYGPKFSGEFAFAVTRVDSGNVKTAADYGQWIKQEKEAVRVKSNVLIPIYFKLL